MGIIVKKELDPIFETFSLLCLADMEDWRGESIKQLAECGLGGEVFFQKHFKIVEKYIRTFQKHKVETPQEEILCYGESETMYILLMALATEYREYLHQPEAADFMKLRRMIAYCLVDPEVDPQIRSEKDLPDLSDDSSLLKLMDKVDIKVEDKWYVLDMLRRPDYWFTSLMEIISLNLPAFERAREAVNKPLEKLLQNKGLDGNNRFTKITETYTDRQEFYVSLSMPMIHATFLSYSYQGVLITYLDAGKAARSDPKDLVIRQAKALSDKSKLDILCELKRARKFNLELAESLGLSPSTVSHHMNSLLICDFVTVEKRDGKVYYCLQEESIREFLSGVEELLL